ncbi:hypothetical protein OJF2_10130 [Aquisphaera giovannonii]|uniref:Uncharacterized protein n=1 Tax=Aquisphaera giovannonii TaxID=406548 RepID=A0A5B9VVR0_9BACT|nr:hypothetical protein OJF2_10130 [Aquisphaera giovannonii]
MEPTRGRSRPRWTADKVNTVLRDRLRSWLARPRAGRSGRMMLLPALPQATDGRDAADLFGRAFAWVKGPKEGRISTPVPDSLGTSGRSSDTTASA